MSRTFSMTLAYVHRKYFSFRFYGNQTTSTILVVLFLTIRVSSNSGDECSLEYSIIDSFGDTISILTYDSSIVIWCNSSIPYEIYQVAVMRVKNKLEVEEHANVDLLRIPEQLEFPIRFSPIPVREYLNHGFFCRCSTLRPAGGDPKTSRKSPEIHYHLCPFQTCVQQRRNCDVEFTQKTNINRTASYSSESTTKVCAVTVRTESSWSTNCSDYSWSTSTKLDSNLCYLDLEGPIVRDNLTDIHSHRYTAVCGFHFSTPWKNSNKWDQKLDKNSIENSKWISYPSLCQFRPFEYPISELSHPETCNQDAIGQIGGPPSITIDGQDSERMGVGTGGGRYYLGRTYFASDRVDISWKICPSFQYYDDTKNRNKTQIPKITCRVSYAVAGVRHQAPSSTTTTIEHRPIKQRIIRQGRCHRLIYHAALSDYYYDDEEPPVDNNPRVFKLVCNATFPQQTFPQHHKTSNQTVIWDQINSENSELYARFFFFVYHLRQDCSKRRPSGSSPTSDDHHQNYPSSFSPGKCFPAANDRLPKIFSFHVGDEAECGGGGDDEDDQIGAYHYRRAKSFAKIWIIVSVILVCAAVLFVSMFIVLSWRRLLLGSSLILVEGHHRHQQQSPTSSSSTIIQGQAKTMLVSPPDDRQPTNHQNVVVVDTNVQKPLKPHVIIESPKITTL